MLQRLFISTCAALLLVGCTATETKPVSPTSPRAPAKVAQPAAKAVKPVLKPKAAVKPQTTPVKAAEPVAVNSDVALGKQWASCAGDIEGLNLFIGYMLKQSPQELLRNPRMQDPLASFQKFPLMRDSLYAYAQAASANPALVATHYQQVSNQQYTKYMTDAASLFKAVQQAPAERDSAVFPNWQRIYFKQVMGMIQNVMGCVEILKQEHNRFDSHVVPNLRYEAVDAVLTQKVKVQPHTPSKKRSRKAS